jgi:hypothetical protein
MSITHALLQHSCLRLHNISRRPILSHYCGSQASAVEDQEVDEADAGAGAAEGSADAAVDMSMFDLSVKKKKKPKKPKKETEEAAAGTAASGDNACDYSYETLLDRIQVHLLRSLILCDLSCKRYFCTTHTSGVARSMIEDLSSEWLPTTYVDHIMPYHTPIS